MTIEELEKQLTELDIQRVKLQEQIKELNENPTPPHPRWIPKEDEKYYTVFGDGTPYTWHWHAGCDDGTTINRHKIGNVFHTQAEAEFVAERLKVLAEMREWAGNYKDAFILTYDTYRKKVFYVPAGDTWIHGEMRFATEKDTENCIKAVGEDRIKKYYFMIPEEEIEK